MLEHWQEGALAAPLNSKDLLPEHLTALCRVTDTNFLERPCHLHLAKFACVKYAECLDRDLFDRQSTDLGSIWPPRDTEVLPKALTGAVSQP